MNKSLEIAKFALKQLKEYDSSDDQIVEHVEQALSEIEAAEKEAVEDDRKADIKRLAKNNPDFPLCSGSGLLSPNYDYSKKIHHIIYGLKSQICNAKLRNDSYDAGYLTAILKEVEELLPNAPQPQGEQND